MLSATPPATAPHNSAVLLQRCDNAISNDDVKRILAPLNCYLEGAIPSVLIRVREILTDPTKTITEFHSMIGGKNALYAGCHSVQFLGPEDFFAKWLSGLIDRLESGQACFGLPPASHRLRALLGDADVHSYIRLFLYRTYFKIRKERERFKPRQELCSLWFGDNNNVMGLVISPTRRGNEWVSDIKEISKVPYDYWTVGHVLHEGLHYPHRDVPVKFEDVSAFLRFYRNYYTEKSKSKYEKGIALRYAHYLEQSTKIEDEPLLIPEFRYGGAIRKHQFRLDFTVLNVHVTKYMGFEASPWSTHGKCEADLSPKGRYQQEYAKRNAYLDRFGIPIVTWTDDSLRDLDDCFRKIANRLAARPPVPVSSAQQLQRLMACP